MAAETAMLAETVLECGHKLLFTPIHTPSPGEICFCTRCDDYRRVPMLKEWQIICLQCRYSRKFGADIDAALLAQARHNRHETEIRQITRTRFL